MLKVLIDMEFFFSLLAPQSDPLYSLGVIRKASFFVERQNLFRPRISLLGFYSVLLPCLFY